MFVRKRGKLKRWADVVVQRRSLTSDQAFTPVLIPAGLPPDTNGEKQATYLAVGPLVITGSVEMLLQPKKNCQKTV
jgi:hypothetical protein